MLHVKPQFNIQVNYKYYVHLCIVWFPLLSTHWSVCLSSLTQSKTLNGWVLEWETCLKTILIFSDTEMIHFTFMQVMKWIWETCQIPTSLNYHLYTRKLRQWPWYSNQAKNKEEEGWWWRWRVWAHSGLERRGGGWWWRHLFSFLHPSNETSHHRQV